MKSGTNPREAERTVDVPKFTIEAAIVPSTINLEDRTVDLVVYSGAAFARYDWESGQLYSMTLSLKPREVRLDRMNDSAPLCRVHDVYDLDSTIGVIVPGTARLVAGQGLVVTARFARDDEDADKVWNKVRQQILGKVSVGAWIYRFEQTDATPESPMKRHATDWEPFEASIVPVGADSGARVLAAETTPKKPCVIVRAQVQETAMEPKDKPAENAPATPPVAPAAPAAVAAAAAASQSNPSDPGAPTGTAAAEPGAPQTAQQRGTVDERNRVQSIMRATLAVGLPVELAQDLIAKGTPVIEAQDIIIEQVAARGGGNAGPTSVPSGAPAVVTRDANSHVRLGITNALLHRMAPQYFKLEDTGKLYRGRQLLQLAEFYLQSCGIRTTHLTPVQIASAALGFQVQAAGMHTTSDFVNILADVANKTLQAAYEVAPQTFLPIIRRTELRDFKPVRRTRISEFPALNEVLEHGEIQAGSMSDAKEQYQLATYATTFNLSREALINDDTNAFSDLAVAAGQAARDKESDLVWAQITGNPLMGDGTALFDAAHGNVSGGAGAIDVTSIGVGRAAMRKQKNIGGRQHINVAPVFLIVPTAIETVADQFVAVVMPQQGSNVNPFAGKLTVIAEPRLDDVSASVWYLGASPAQIPMVELAFLAGQNGPLIESRSGWDVQGLQMKVVHDVGAKVMDWKGFYRNSA